ncbi:hypothetical protein QQG74_24785 [Micromonospora sp. FIMYZ51]|uniref:hypothetical protein n=1 Tax=Micromonospora sp. FIMYZ51 TaxID=3051832 RepID=UPI00311E489F
MTQNHSREELVHKYFNVVPRKPSYLGPLIALGGGGLLLVVGILSFIGSSVDSSQPGLVCLGCLGILGGGAAVVAGGISLAGKYSAYNSAMAAAFPRASDAQMDTWLEEGENYAADAGRRRLNRHPGEVTLKWGENLLVFHGLPPDVPIQIARGADGNLRASLYKILVVYLSSYRLLTYESILDMRTGMTVSDATKEYHLQSVDGLETASDRVNLFLPPGDQAQPPPGHPMQSPPGYPMQPPPGHPMQSPPGHPMPPHQTAIPIPIAGGGIVHMTGRQTLRLMVAGRPAIELVMGIAATDQLHIEGVSGSTTESMIHTLREYLRRHNGGISGQPSVPGSIPPLGPE